MRPPLTAYADESFLEHDLPGYYVVANAIVDRDQWEEARQTMNALRGGRRVGKTHWTEMDTLQRKQASDAVAAIEGLHIIAVGTPVPPRRQERARARCLERLVSELHGYGVENLIMEARAPALNKRDVRTVIGARYALPTGTRFTIEHVKGAEEPLLWVVDVLAGAVRAGHEGNEIYQSILAERIYEIDVDTGC